MSSWIIAIDGPSASGKSTVSRRVAAELGAVYVDSGSLYRGLTWACIKDGLDAWDDESVLAAASRRQIHVFLEDAAVRYTLDGLDPRDFLRSPSVVERVSKVAAVPGVRSLVVDCLRAMTRFGNLVMEGRDIGTAVFPEANYKFFLDANPEERARRRQRELSGSGALPAPGELEEVSRSLARRDAQDSARAADPLRVAPGALVMDTTFMPLDEVTNAILARVRAGEGLHASD